MDNIIRLSNYFSIYTDRLLTGEERQPQQAAANSPEEAELLRIYNSLDVRARTRLLSFAFELEGADKPHA